MASKTVVRLFSNLIITVTIAACGGSDASDNPSPSHPESPSQAFKFELLSGSTSVNLDDCQVVNGAAPSARYTRLLRATAYVDAVYLVETGEGCTNVTYDARGVVPLGVQPTIRKLSAGKVETHIQLNDYITNMSHPVMVRYPSGFVRTKDQGGLVLGFVAASSGQGFTLDAAEVARYEELGGWNFYAPGLFNFTAPMAGYSDLVAGTLGKPTKMLDGQGRSAAFFIPHDLEVDSSGLLHLIDDGHIRTTDKNYEVRTLNHAALGINGVVRALDSDSQGKIHALVKRAGGGYTWHKLSDGAQVSFETRGFVNTEPVTSESIAVVGSDMIMSVRLPSGATSIYRVASNGVVSELTGSRTPSVAQDALDQPSQYLMPPIQHIEYGPDGNLYAVLPQGILVARNFK